MAFKVLRTTALFKAPDANSDILAALMEGEMLAFAGEKKDTFIKIKHPSVNDPGWVQAGDCQEVDDAPRPPVNLGAFVSSCVLAERAVNAQPATAPWLVAADFVIARAIIETDIANVGPKIPGSDGVGPLQVTSKEWDDFTKSPLGVEGEFPADGRDEPTVQTSGAAFRMFADAKAISELKAAKGVGSKDDPFLPSFLDVFHAYLTNSPAAAVALFDAGADDAGKAKKLTEVLKGPLTEDQIAAFFAARSQFAGSAAAPKSVGEFVEMTKTALDSALKKAFDLEKQFVPEELPQIKQGEAPWLDVAKKEQDAGIAEPNQRILTYFKDTDLRPLPTSTTTPWCGAFAAFCMANCGSDAAKAAIPAGAAQAVKWKGFGSQLPLKTDNVPNGAVVVLSPGEGTGGSGHVAFFVGYTPDKKFAQLLGGNQRNSVKVSNFPVSQIAAICWLDLGPEHTADQAGAEPSNLPISKEAFDLIIEFEVSSEAAYRKKYHLPEWPGESSGVTIGIGYDVGQTPAATFEADWKGRIPDAMFTALRATVGITGARAKPLAAQLRSTVDIPWETALAVHTEKVIPRWVGVVKSALANVEQLKPPSLGALVSLTYNRGSSYSKPDTTPEQRFREMHQIKAAMAAPNFAAIPQLIIDMKRLWPSSEGLRRRRDKEAEFFRQGL